MKKNAERVHIMLVIIIIIIAVVEVKNSDRWNGSAPSYIRYYAGLFATASILRVVSLTQDSVGHAFLDGDQHY